MMIIIHYMRPAVPEMTPNFSYHPTAIYLALAADTCYVMPSCIAHVDLSTVFKQTCTFSLGKGQVGSALMGSLHILVFLTEGLFGYFR